MSGTHQKEWDGWESHLVHFHKFASLPSGKNKLVRSPEFRIFGHVWRVNMYRGGHSEAEEGKISLFLEHCSYGDFSVQFNLSIKNKSGGAVAERRDSPHKFEGKTAWWGWLATRAMITHDVNNESLTVEVRMKPDDHEGNLCQNFIPKNLFLCGTCFCYSWMRNQLICHSKWNHALSSTHQRTHHLLSVKFSVHISLC